MEKETDTSPIQKCTRYQRKKPKTIIRMFIEKGPYTFIKIINYKMYKSGSCK